MPSASGTTEATRIIWHARRVIIISNIKARAPYPHTVVLAYGAGIPRHAESHDVGGRISIFARAPGTSPA